MKRSNLPVMMPAERLEFLTRRTSFNAAEFNRGTRPPRAWPSALGYLPLALELAAALVVSLRLTMRVALRVARRSACRCSRRASRSRRTSGSIATTWLLNCQTLERTCPDSAHLASGVLFLGARSPFYRTDHPGIDATRTSPPAGGSASRGLGACTRPAHGAAHTALAGPLQSRSRELYQMHRMVQHAVLRYSLDAKGRELWAGVLACDGKVASARQYLSPGNRDSRQPSPGGRGVSEPGATRAGSSSWP